PYTARLSRQHNNAQILCLGARVVGAELAKEIVDAFLAAEFEGGRHSERVDLIANYENAASADFAER
ncbi:MAG: RpiB/LacA/LacB family sugar-phosphate isomerase, partial [Defluviitaleaceae bacterium]|nr:RpiB/LacA/LacB family sugar-phosphate isomerase [Defluviitaleaceae bacterium]